MYVQTKKVAPWGTKDYVKTILFFLINYIILGALSALAVFFNVRDKAGNATFPESLTLFKEYFTVTETRSNFIYLMIALALILFVIYMYYYYERRDFLKMGKNIAMMFSILIVSLVISYAIGSIGHVYARPIALCALLSLLLIDRASAIFMNVAMCMIMFLADTYTGAQYSAGFSALVIGFSAGLVAIYLVSGVNSRLKVLLMGLVVSVPIIVSIFVLEGADFDHIPFMILNGVSAGMFSVSFELILVPIFERIFNQITSYRLSEITDHKFRLMRKLISEAPGTFNHCLVVSNLAEACASAIGEDSQVARAAAYYHDFGKLSNPAFYSENQMGSNPHDNITPELSAEIIMRHTEDGAALLKKYHMPQILIDVALQHHGTLPIRYFYVKASKMTDGELDIKNFSYPGPKPQTKIAAIIMIADGCEAKARTIKDRTHANVDKAVKEIIEERMDLEQFTDCDITLKELDIIRATLVNALVGVYHDRVAYPKLKLVKRKD
ncbi:MAG: HDIG domain-containing protein [Clostridia bacterium]|nr:HDIG domain-containing protein [Clostridia bacterium]